MMAQTQKYGAFKAATSVGVRTNGFSQNTFQGQIWEQPEKTQAGGPGTSGNHAGRK